MWPLWKQRLSPSQVMLAKRQQFSDRIHMLSFTGVCDIHEHTGDDVPVGRCCFSTYDEICPRHGLIEMYPNRDDREVDPINRIFERE